MFHRPARRDPPGGQPETCGCHRGAGRRAETLQAWIPVGCPGETPRMAERGEHAIHATRSLSPPGARPCEALVAVRLQDDAVPAAESIGTPEQGAHAATSERRSTHEYSRQCAGATSAKRKEQATHAAGSLTA